MKTKARSILEIPVSGQMIPLKPGAEELSYLRRVWDVFFILIGLVLLILGGNWLLKAAVALSLALSIPRIVIGMTVVSFATSAPELIVSISAAASGFPDLALGNVVGSNIANLGLVLAITVMLGHMDVRKSFYTTDWPLLMGASLLFYVLLHSGNGLNRTEGGLMVVCLVLFLVFLLRFQKPAVEGDLLEDDEPLPLYKTLFFLLIGSLGLWSGSELLVQGATGTASAFGVSDRVIGISVVSIGTSIPELAASIVAVLKQEKAISLGNLVGSNIFNILAVMGITALIVPVPVADPWLLEVDLLWMLGVAFLVLPLVFIPKGLRLGWRDGIVLLGVYAAFLYSSVF